MIFVVKHLSTVLASHSSRLSVDLADVSIHSVLADERFLADRARRCLVPGAVNFAGVLVQALQTTELNIALFAGMHLRIRNQF